MKKYITPINIFITLGLLIHFAIFQIWGREYGRYYMYFLILIMIPFIIFNLIKQRREDKADGTQKFKLSIYNILVTMVIMGIFFFLIYSDYPSAY